MLKLNLKSRKQKHVECISDHIFDLHRKLNSETIGIDELDGKELENKVKRLQVASAKIKKYAKYYKLLTF